MVVKSDMSVLLADAVYSCFPCSLVNELILLTLLSSFSSFSSFYLSVLDLLERLIYVKCTSSFSVTHHTWDRRRC